MEWISTKDKLPKERKFILIYVEWDEHQPIQYGFFDKGIFYKDELNRKEVEYKEIAEVKHISHWMPLPKEPLKE